MAGLGACSIFLAGLWLPAVAQASLITPLKINSTLIGKSGSYKKPVSAESGAEFNENVSGLVLASRRNSSYREEHTRSRNQGYRANRGNNRIYRENNRRRKGRGFSSQGRRDYSRRERQPHVRSYRGRGKNSFRDNNPNIYKRPKSHRFEFITPGD